MGYELWVQLVYPQGLYLSWTIDLVTKPEFRIIFSWDFFSSTGQQSDYCDECISPCVFAKSVNMNMDCVATLFPWLACGVVVLLQILSKQAVVH